MNVVRFRGAARPPSKVLRKMIFPSPSTERRCPAARKRRRVFESSSRLRIVLLAIGQTPIRCRMCPIDWMLALQARWISLSDARALEWLRTAKQEAALPRCAYAAK